jgi:meso-butanediol dehydrogenase/(S,S)-butanediol dehydrogenase/diacetyl reductase
MIASSGSVESRVAVVTGGSSGIGAASAKALHARGYSVVIVGRDEGRLRAVAESCPGMDLISLDLSTPQGNHHMIEQVGGRLGRIDVLVNASGILGDAVPLAEVREEDWDLVLATNLRGPIAATMAAIPYLIETKGSVVNISSINAIQAEYGIAPYSVSKAALAGFTKCAAIDLGQFGVRVNAVLPGWVRTPMIHTFLNEAEVKDNAVSTNALGRIAEPGEIATVVAFLASTDSSFITGECLVVDGGQWIYARDLAPVGS